MNGYSIVCIPHDWQLGAWYKPHKTIYAFGPFRLALHRAIGPWKAKKPVPPPTPDAPRLVTRDEFDDACDALWTEIEYQNNLARRTGDSEARDIPAFLTLGHRYARKVEDAWADWPGNTDEAKSGLRKLAAIYLRGMIYCGIVHRSTAQRSGD